MYKVERNKVEKLSVKIEKSELNIEIRNVSGNTLVGRTGCSNSCQTFID
jgi:hypothetical protein